MPKMFVLARSRAGLACVSLCFYQIYWCSSVHAFQSPIIQHNNSNVCVRLRRPSANGCYSCAFENGKRARNRNGEEHSELSGRGKGRRTALYDAIPSGGHEEQDKKRIFRKFPALTSILKKFMGHSEHDKDIAAMAFPALMSLLVDPTMSIIDTGYVGRLGPTSIASLGPCTSIFHFCFNTFRSLTHSTTSLISTYLAQGETDAAASIAQQSSLLASILGLSVMALMLINARSMLTLMGAGTHSILHKEAFSYLSVRALAAPAVLCLMVAEGIFRGHSDTRTPALISIGAAATNLVLDPFFIFTCGMGVAGAAGATVLAQYLALLMYFVSLSKRSKSGRWKIEPVLDSKVSPLTKPATSTSSSISGEFPPVLDSVTSVPNTLSTSTDNSNTTVETRLDPDTHASTTVITTTPKIPTTQNSMKSSIGSDAPTSTITKTTTTAVALSSTTTTVTTMNPSSKPIKAFDLLRTILFANGAMLLRTVSVMACWATGTAIVTRMGPLEVGAHQVGLSLWLLMALIAEAPAIAGQVLSARYLGQQKHSTARDVAVRVVSVTAGFSSLLGIILLLFCNALPALFTTDIALAARIRALLPWLAIQQPLVAITLVEEGVLVGAGEFQWLCGSALLSTAISTCAILGVGRYAPASGVIGVWGGLTLMFVVRFSAATARLLDRKRGTLWEKVNLA